MKYLLIIFFSLFFTNLISEDIKEYIVTGSDVTKTTSFDFIVININTIIAKL